MVYFGTNHEKKQNPQHNEKIKYFKMQVGVLILIIKLSATDCSTTLQID